jgi:hypothetical protein
LEHPGKSCSPVSSQDRESYLKESSTDTGMATNRLPQPADWRYKLIRRLLAHC